MYSNMIKPYILANNHTFSSEFLIGLLYDPTSTITRGNRKTRQWRNASLLDDFVRGYRCTPKSGKYKGAFEKRSIKNQNFYNSGFRTSALFQFPRHCTSTLFTAFLITNFPMLRFMRPEFSLEQMSKFRKNLSQKFNVIAWKRLRIDSVCIFEPIHL